MYKIQDYRKVEGKKNLRGFIDLYLPEERWLVHGFSLFSNEGGYWINSPSQVYKNERGENKYINIIQMSKEDGTVFSQKVLKALKEYNPNDPKPFEFKKSKNEQQIDMFELPF